MHRGQHLLYSGGEADCDGATDNAVAYVQLDEVRHSKKSAHVLIVQAVASIDLKAELVRRLCGGLKLMDLFSAFLLAVEAFGKRSGMQLYKPGADCMRR